MFCVHALRGFANIYELAMKFDTCVQNHISVYYVNFDLGVKICSDKPNPGADPTTFEFAATTPALKWSRAFFQSR
jgi:hypothetical protein